MASCRVAQQRRSSLSPTPLPWHWTIKARGLVAGSCRFSVVRPLLDVVHEREQFPLTIDFVSTAQGEAIQSLVVAKVAEHRLDGGEARALLLATFVAVDACAHRLQQHRRRMR